jgi:hypothetical protein
MGNLVWSAAFLLVTLVVSPVAAAAMIGMPIDNWIQVSVFGVAALLTVWGVALLAATPVPKRMALANNQRCFQQDDSRS